MVVSADTMTDHAIDALQQETRVQVYWTSIDSFNPALAGVLGTEEEMRASTIRGRDAYRRFVVGAALLRSSVAASIGVRPSEVRIARNCPQCPRPHGKPEVVDGDGLQVSVSHSGALVGVALCYWPVGIDVEQYQTLANLEAVVAAVCTGEEAAAVRRASEPMRQFLRLWTCKEAVIKATGAGLRTPLNGVAIAGLTGGSPAEHHPNASHPISVRELASNQQHAAAAAVITSSRNVVIVENLLPIDALGGPTLKHTFGGDIAKRIASAYDVRLRPIRR